MDGDPFELRHALDRVNIHVLTTGVVLQVAFMPLILHGGAVSWTGHATILVATYASEAVCFIMMILIRARGRSRALQLWMSSALAHAPHDVLEGGSE
jgi:hypothetical protein